MRATFAILFMLTLSTITPSTAQAEGTNKGFSTTLNLGGNFLIPMGDNPAYDMLDPSFGMNLGLMYRFGPMVALQLNYLIGLYDTPSGAGSPYARFMALGVGPRFFIPAGPVEVFIDLGLGWDMLSTGEGGTDSSTHGFDLAFGVGAEYEVLDGLSVGLGLQYHFPFFFYGCFTSPSDGETCDTVNAKVKDTPHDLMFGASVTVYWGKLFGQPAEKTTIVPGGRSSLPSGGSNANAHASRPAVKDTRAVSATKKPGPSGQTQGRVLPLAFTSQGGDQPQVVLGDVQNDVVNAFDMPTKMEHNKLVYSQGAKGLDGFRQVTFLFGDEKELRQVDFTPVRGIAQQTIRAELGEPTRAKKAARGIIIWIYKKVDLAFYFKPGSEQAYHMRMKSFQKSKDQ